MGFDTTPVGLKVIAAAIVSVGTAQFALCWKKKKEREREKSNSFLTLSPFIQKLVSQRLNRWYYSACHLYLAGKGTDCPQVAE